MALHILSDTVNAEGGESMTSPVIGMICHMRGTVQTASPKKKPEVEFHPILC